jgi:hypothetical protein
MVVRSGAIDHESLLERLQKVFQTLRGADDLGFRDDVARGCAPRDASSRRVPGLGARPRPRHADTDTDTDTDTIIGAVRADFGGVSQQAVYDVLRALTTAGLVRRIPPTGSAAQSSHHETHQQAAHRE